jgi:hypothetical protein
VVPVPILGGEEDSLVTLLVMAPVVQTVLSNIIIVVPYIHIIVVR